MIYIVWNDIHVCENLVAIVVLVQYFELVVFVVVFFLFLSPGFPGYTQGKKVRNWGETGIGKK